MGADSKPRPFIIKNRFGPDFRINEAVAHRICGMVQQKVWNFRDVHKQVNNFILSTNYLLIYGRPA